MPSSRSHQLAVFVVAGSGPFPFDMLRKDECFPLNTESAAAIGMEVADLRARDSRRAVRLGTYKPLGPTIARWESFGWKVQGRDVGGGFTPGDIEASIASERAGEAAIS
jgi:hypothetical protein